MTSFCLYSLILFVKVIDILRLIQGSLQEVISYASICSIRLPSLIGSTTTSLTLKNLVSWSLREKTRLLVASLSFSVGWKGPTLSRKFIKIILSHLLGTSPSRRYQKSLSQIKLYSRSRTMSHIRVTRLYLSKS